MYSSCEILGFPDLGKVSKNRKANYMFTKLLKTDNFQLYIKLSFVYLEFSVFKSLAFICFGHLLFFS